eukprot:13075551-Heterocapsa_arctica.AAC.1
MWRRWKSVGSTHRSRLRNSSGYHWSAWPRYPKIRCNWRTRRRCRTSLLHRQTASVARTFASGL